MFAKGRGLCWLAVAACAVGLVSQLLAGNPWAAAWAGFAGASWLAMALTLRGWQVDRQLVPLMVCEHGSNHVPPLGVAQVHISCPTPDVCSVFNPGA